MALNGMWPSGVARRGAARSAGSPTCSNCSTTTTRHRTAAFFACDGEGRIVDCGKGSFELTGLKTEQVIGRPISEVLGLAFDDGTDHVQTALEWEVRVQGKPSGFTPTVTSPPGRSPTSFRPTTTTRAACSWCSRRPTAGEREVAATGKSGLASEPDDRPSAQRVHPAPGRRADRRLGGGDRRPRRRISGWIYRAGVQLTYQGEPTPSTPVVTPAALARAVDVMRQRTNQLGVSETQIATSGTEPDQRRTARTSPTSSRPSSWWAPPPGWSSTTGRPTS